MEDTGSRPAIPRQSCCRLCLAPDNECVSIFGTKAADKQPISLKIQACVNIQVNSTDRLSGRICHICISFLNSWVSFRSRCVAAQQKQKTWLADQLKRQLEGGTTDAWRTAKSSESKEDDDSGPVTVNMELDPAAFLGADDDEDDLGDDDDDDGLEEGEFVEKNHSNPQILNALGLRNVNMNPMSMLATDMLMNNSNDDADLGGGDDDDLGEDRSGGGSVPGAQCRVCRMSFSNRANARRHEKNLHGLRTSVAGGVDGDLQSGNSNASMNATPKSSPSIMAGGVAKVPVTGSSSANAAVATPGGSASGSGTAPSSSRKSSSSEVEVFDYSKPEKYRHLLTESRMAFIRRNARFLHQYQDMTCKCCDRQYFTYKTFMSHMRKKYTTLPRNVCFNCLRKFETKGQFIAHLKKRNCLNLFTLFMADATIHKDAKLMSAVGGAHGGAFGGGAKSSGEQRIGLKEMLTNKVYGCQICQEQFRLKNDFRSHVVAAHPDLQSCRDPVTGNCRHCSASFADSTERKRHFSGMDCLVVIICSTCDNQFPSHAKFLDHVYGTHLKELNAADQRAAALNSERMLLEGQVKKEDQQQRHIAGGGQQQQQQQQLMPKKNAGCVCPICEKQYNNYYNVLWHFESKHPEHVPATYRCEICEAMFTKQALLKSHVQGEHADSLLLKNDSQSSAAAAVQVSPQGTFKCRHCDEVLPRAADYIDHQLVDHPDEELLACHECEFVTEQKQRLEEHLKAQHLSLKVRVMNCSVCKQSFVTEAALKCHTMLQHAENESSEQQFRRMLRAAKFPVTAKKEVKMEVDDEEEPRSNDDEGEDDDLLQDTSLVARAKEEESQRIRECPICVEKFAVLGEFVVHMQRHVETDNVTNLDVEPGKSKSGGYHSRMRCRMCQKRISSKVGYRRHLMEEHAIVDCEFVRCDLCPGEFSNEKGLKVHLYRTHNICVKEDGEVVTMGPQQQNQHHHHHHQQQQDNGATVTEYECQICHTVYRSLGLLRSHVQSVHQMNDWDAYLQQYGSGEVQGAAAGKVVNEHQLETMSLMVMNNALAVMSAADNDDLSGTGGGGGTDYTPIEVYFQCRYCDENFASRQKLTAHMNTHEEHDPTDYTCKECGNVYQSRKSLWVHRNKKHPKSQVPSPCEICKKVFFDKTELVYHLKTHVAAHMEQMSELMNGQMGVGHHQVGIDDNDDDEEEGEEVESGEESGVNGGAGERKYDCHVCNRKFRDPQKLSQHLRIHEMENMSGLFGSFADTGMEGDEGTGTGGSTAMNGDTGDLFEPQYTEDGTEEFACDMCPKRFPQLMALRVHRGWHYRSPDGRQITDQGQTWQPGSLRSQRGSRGTAGAAAASATASARSSTSGGQTAVAAAAVVKVEKDPQVANNNNHQLSNNNNNNTNNSGLLNPRLPKCHFCHSTFASANNLRRHIVEVHKRNDWRAQSSGSGSSSGGGGAAAGGNKSNVRGAGFVDRDRECQACNKSFETRQDWVDHKIGHAKVMRPSMTFEWNCEVCGKVFTRKERLLQHMASHLTEPEGSGTGMMSRGEHSNEEDSRETGEEEGEADEEDDDEEEAMVVNPDVEMLADDDDDDDEEEEDEDDEEGEAEGQPEIMPELVQKKDKSLCCDLCQVSFTDEKELRRHVMAHFFNGGNQAPPPPAAVTTATATTTTTTTPPEATIVEATTKKTKIEEEDGVSEDQPVAKKAKVDIPEVRAEEDEDEEGEYVEEEEEESATVAVVMGEGEPLNGAADGSSGKADVDLDEGEYIEEYFDEDSLVSPKKTSPQQPPRTQAAAVQQQQQQCRLCSTGYENSFKALKCMESHRQRSKYQCQECELYFATPKQLAGHQQLIHGGV